MAELTGRTRYRHHTSGLFFRKTVLVLQVEEKVTKSDFYAGFHDSWTINEWRDATINDLTVIDRTENSA